MNYDAIIQIAIVIVAVVGGFYLGKFLRGRVEKEQLDMAYLINSIVEEYVLDNELAKKISRIIGKAIRYVEVEMEGKSNEEKEDVAYELIVEAITALGIDNPIDEEALRRIIRIANSFMEPTHPENDFDLKELIEE